MQNSQVGDRASVSRVSEIGSESRPPARHRVLGTVRLLDPLAVGAAADPRVLIEVEMC